ncbi:PilZ domain-containing protein [Desulfovibrio ferrophilus]|uniref:PilZ domain-containing protein n=1 Tax=Desulfovibrio ferrophilus TaxID=241368 RepID=A0A2Z6AZI3_9BACT|nr:PilZ domain-containing protein [Desulfovibrio ferrophilus]BBD08659.1 PilZ domain-containing protein [Desulfovibrio ferrophilus]
MPNARSRSRVPGQFEALVICGDRSIPVITDNLSLKGMLCHTGDCSGLEAGTLCTLRLELARDIAVEISASVVRCGEDSLAMNFQDMDAASFAHLRNIVRFASEDADAIDGEVGTSGEV